MQTTPNYSFESLYLEHYSSLVGYIRGSFSKISKFTEEVANDAFVDFWKYRAKNENKDILEALERCARHRAISLIRKLEALKRGGGDLVSFEGLRELGFEPRESIFGGNWRIGDGEAEQILRLQCADQLALVDRVLEVAIPRLLEKELILVRHIRRWAPGELTLEELSAELSPQERLRFLPVQRRSLHKDSDDFVVREVGRSRSRLQGQLRETRLEMGI